MFGAKANSLFRVTIIVVMRKMITQNITSWRSYYIFEDSQEVKVFMLISKRKKESGQNSILSYKFNENLSVMDACEKIRLIVILFDWSVLERR